MGLTAVNLPDWMLSYNKRTDIHFDKRATVTLAQAIRTAEASQNGAPAVAAGIAVSASNPEDEVHAYNILLDTGGTVQRVAVDTSTGQVIADPSALSNMP